MKLPFVWRWRYEKLLYDRQIYGTVQHGLAQHWKAQYFEAYKELRKANKGIQRLRRKLDRLKFLLNNSYKGETNDNSNS